MQLPPLVVVKGTVKTLNKEKVHDGCSEIPIGFTSQDDVIFSIYFVTYLIHVFYIHMTMSLYMTMSLSLQEDTWQPRLSP
jgi:hypothetical protein